MRRGHPARAFACAGLLIGLAGCKPGPLPEAASTSTSASSARAAPTVTPWTLPAAPGASSPDLRRMPDGRLLLGWLQAGESDTQHFRFAIADAKGGWKDAPRAIASGTDLVANWADTPHLVDTADGALWAHWLRRQGGGRGGYDVVLARSGDAGRSWSAAVKVNDDGTDSEHGFATLWPEGRDRIGIAWLDGRNTSAQAHAHHGGGRMTLRTAIFDGRLARADERELDASTCDCCQTGAALVAGEPVLAWRGRDTDETRDILASRRIDGQWQAARSVHADGWKIAGCPVNGPALAAYGRDVLAGWYTEADGGPKVRIALDGGRGFGPMVEVDTGAPVLGRVAVALDAKQAWIAWLRETDGVQSLMLSRRSPSLEHEYQRIEVAKLKARGHASGLPRLAVDGRGAWLVWTDVEAGARVLRGARIRLP